MYKNKGHQTLHLEKSHRVLAQGSHFAGEEMELLGWEVSAWSTDIHGLLANELG